MALKPLNPGLYPLGQYDVLDTDIPLLKGGEVMKFASTTAASGGDKGAADAFDGYTNPSSVANRPLVQRAGPGGTPDGYVRRPLMLSDDGIVGYGTILGTVVGGTAGQLTGSALGPSSATGSGKCTVWEKPGLYAVSLDAVDTTAVTGLIPTNTVITTGSSLTFTSAGLLCTSASGNGVCGSQLPAVVGNFVSFESNGSLVSTPNRLVAALNSPSGLVSSLGPRQFAFATFWFQPVAPNAIV